MKHKSVLLDTSFFIRLLNDEDPLHTNALGYFKYFLEQDIVMKISTISIAEYCVKGGIQELPLRNLQIIPFNLDHAQQTGEFTRVVFEENQQSVEKLHPRILIPNDSKLFAQANGDKSTTFFVTSDERSKKVWAKLRNRLNLTFEFINIRTPYHETFGILEL